MRYAVFSMDIEDWYHLDYFRDKDCNKSCSLLDGINRFQEIIESYCIPASFFVVGELINVLSGTLRRLDTKGHDLAVHGWNHTRPITMNPQSFRVDVDRSKKELEDALGRRIIGYRAPCFSMDRERLDILREVGFKYDSSRILFGEHPLYKEINLDGFEEMSSNIFRLDNFFEFQVSTLKLGQKHIPVSGGGYLRIFPWALTRKLLNRYLDTDEFYVLYIHPFELSSKPNPPFPAKAAIKDRLRFGLGRSTVSTKLNSLVRLLKSYGFKFTTFSSLREQILHERKR